MAEQQHVYKALEIVINHIKSIMMMMMVDNLHCFIVQYLIHIVLCEVFINIQISRLKFVKPSVGVPQGSETFVVAQQLKESNCIYSVKRDVTHFLKNNEYASKTKKKITIIY